eukprot:COSAG03_NODE_24081_length_275_cov_0.568182_1_plen_21_part_10
MSGGAGLREPPELPARKDVLR